MAISTLLPAGGANDNRPNLKQFFGRNPDTANDNVQRVSSGMFSNTFVDSVVGALQGLVQEIAKITEIAQKVIASFGTIVKSLKNLNKDITSRFRVLNNELNASRIDFIRTVLAIPKSDAPIRIDGVPVNVKQEEQKKEGGDEGGGLSGFIEKILELWLIKKLGDAFLKPLMDLIKFAKDGLIDIVRRFIQYDLPAILNFLKGNVAGPLVNTLRSVVMGPALAPVVLAGGFIALAQWAAKQRIENPDGWQDFLLKMRSGAERSKVITGPQAETDKFGPLQESGVISPFNVLRANGLVKDQKDVPKVVDFLDGDIVTLKDGRWFDTKSKSTELQPPETNPSAKAKAKKGQPTQAITPMPSANVGAPTQNTSSPSAPAALGQTGAGGFSLGGVTGSPPPAANQNGMPAGEVKNESNAPAPPPGAPSAKGTTTTPPVPAAGPSGGTASAGGGVAVVQNSSVQNVGSVAGAETGGMTGQNLPMFVRNSKLQSTFGMQNVKYQ